MDQKKIDYYLGLSRDQMKVAAKGGGGTRTVDPRRIAEYDAFFAEQAVKDEYQRPAAATASKTGVKTGRKSAFVSKIVWRSGGASGGLRVLFRGINNYAVMRLGSKRASIVRPTQSEAIAQAKLMKNASASKASKLRVKSKKSESS